MSAEEQAKRLLSMIGRLANVLREENERLSHPGRAPGLKEIVSKKEALGRAYEQQMEALGKEEELTKINPDLRQRLTEAATHLVELMEENKRRLEAKMEATKQVFKIIAEAAKEYRAASASYGRTGAVGVETSQARKAYRPVVSVGVNREL